MRMLTFANRNTKEILRDPLNLAFGLGFPLVLLVLLSTIQKNVPQTIFEIQWLTPGVGVFGLSFVTLFSATLVSRDRDSALLQRLYTTPLTPRDFILGYTLPMIPIAVVQSIICYLAAWLMGLKLTINVIYAIVLTIPIALLYIGLGLLCGSCLNVKQVGGICGALLTNLSAWLSGTWFDLALVGEGFGKVANLLPFVHAVELERGILAGEYSAIAIHLLWVLGYAVVTISAAVFLFFRQMKIQ